MAALWVGLRGRVRACVLRGPGGQTNVRVVVLLPATVVVVGL
ncbi:MAG TPA: hypothetical protein VK891_11615 [Euzebyales bacterium]|nr:hypothetical protein [Euzebyales bacterium]